MKNQRGTEIENHGSRGLNLFAIFLACLTVVLLIAGALVTTRDAGDSVPDWPLSFGRWLIHSDYFVANVRYEYTHRVIAGLVGAGTFGLAVWAWMTDRRMWLKRLALAAFAGVVLQALIGGVRVLFPTQKSFIAIPHAFIAQSFFAVIVSIAVFTSKGWFRHGQDKQDAGRPALRRLTAITVAAILIQLVLGAGFRHQAFGIIPHITGAVGVTVMVVWTSVAVFKRHVENDYLRRPALTLLMLLIIQVMLGVSAYLARLASVNDPQPLEPMITLTVAHVVVGALTLVTAVVLMLRSYRVLAPVAASARGVAEARTEMGGSPRRATV